jgi:hypothetical protein
MVFPAIPDFCMKRAHTRFLAGPLRLHKLSLKLAILFVEREDVAVTCCREILQAQVKRARPLNVSGCGLWPALDPTTRLRMAEAQKELTDDLGASFAKGCLPANATLAECGLLRGDVNDLRSIIRVAQGRQGQPSAVILD